LKLSYLTIIKLTYLQVGGSLTGTPSCGREAIAIVVADDALK